MLAADSAGLIDALGLGRVAVMGHSMGGFIAQQLVLDRPELVSKLILASTNFGGPNAIPVTPDALAAMLDRSGDPAAVIRRGIAIACAPGFAEAHPEIVQELTAYRLTAPVPPAAYQAQMAVGLGLLAPAAAFEGRLKAVAVPTLILFGEHDKVVPPGNAALLRRDIPQARVAVLPNAGHMFPIEAPETAAQTVIDFLRE
jgi:pimeloyl-ACP methyl ester carboxylesterase